MGKDKRYSTKNKALRLSVNGRKKKTNNIYYALGARGVFPKGVDPEKYKPKVVSTSLPSPFMTGDMSEQESSIDFDVTSPSQSSFSATPEMISIGPIVKMEDAPPPLVALKRKAPAEPSLPKPTKKKTGDAEIEYIKGAIEKLQEISNRVTQTPREDCYDHFGKYVTSMLRSIGPPTSMRLQEQITSLLTQAMCPPPTTTPMPSWTQPVTTQSLDEGDSDSDVNGY